MSVLHSPARRSREERVGGAEPELALFEEFPGLGHVVHDPGELARGEVGVEGQAAALHHFRFGAIPLQPFHRGAGAVVLPDDHVRDRHPGVRMPGETALPLVVDPHGGDTLPPRPGRSAGSGPVPQGRAPPSRVGIELPVPGHRGNGGVSIGAHGKRPGTGGSLVNGEDGHCGRFCRNRIAHAEPYHPGRVCCAHHGTLSHSVAPRVPAGRARPAAMVIRLWFGLRYPSGGMDGFHGRGFSWSFHAIRRPDFFRLLCCRKQVMGRMPERKRNGIASGFPADETGYFYFSTSGCTASGM